MKTEKDGLSLSCLYTVFSNLFIASLLPVNKGSKAAKNKTEKLMGFFFFQVEDEGGTEAGYLYKGCFTSHYDGK